MVGDLDGSGRMAILLMPQGGAYDDTRYKKVLFSKHSANGIVVQGTTVPYVARDGAQGIGGKILMDLNGDGMPDAVEYPTQQNSATSSSTYFVNTGSGMLGPTANFRTPVNFQDRIWNSDCGGAINCQSQYVVLDVNQDGRDDIISAPLDPNSQLGLPLRVFLSNGKGLSHSTTAEHGGDDSGKTITWTCPQTSPWFRSLDANGDGLGDFMMEDQSGHVNVYLHDGNKADMITAFHHGNGATTKVTYSPWQDSSANGQPCRHPLRCPKVGLWVVSESHLEVPGSAVSLNNREYTYSRAALDVLGRGWLGFGLRTMTNRDTGTTVEYETWHTTRVGTSYPYAYRPRKIVKKTTLEDGTELTSTHEIQFAIVKGAADPAGSAFAVGPTIGLLWETEKAPGDDVPPTLRQIQSFTSYDAMGHVKKVQKVAFSGEGAENVDTVEYEYLNDVTNWVLSPVTLQLMTSVTPDATATRKTTFEYDQASPGLLRKTFIEPDGNDMDYLELRISQRSKFGLPEVVSAVSREGVMRSESIFYDDIEGSKVAVRINPLGHVSRTVYHPGLNLPVTSVDNNGLTTEMFYYPFGRLKSVLSPDGNSIGISYTAASDVSGGVMKVGASLASGEQVSTVFDVLGRSIATHSKLANGRFVVQKSEYEQRFPSAISAISIPRFTDAQGDDRFSRITYDAAGRMRTATSPDGRKVEVTYSGLRVSTRDAVGRESYTESDALGRIIVSTQKKSASDADGMRELSLYYTYGPFGVLRWLFDDFDHCTTTQFDVRGRKTGISDPDTGSTHVTYNAFGDVIEVRNENGSTIYEPDPLGRPESVTSKEGTATFVWDKAAHGIGMLESAVSCDGVQERYTYDQISRLSSSTWTVEGERFSVEQTYDALGRPDVLTYPETPGWSLFKTQYHYGENGELTSLTNASNDHILWKLEDVYASGVTKLERFGNQLDRNYSFDEVLGVVTGVKTQRGAQSLQDLSYTHYDDGNIKTRKDTISGLQELFEYDSLGRLKTWKETGDQGWSVTYGQDDLGNLASRMLENSNGDVVEDLVFEHNGLRAGPHAITSSPWGTYEYDSVGNLTSSPIGTIEYTAFNLPKRILGDSNSEFLYDAAGKRVSKAEANGRTLYIGGLYERRTLAGNVRHVLKLAAGGRGIGQVVRDSSGGGESVTYIHGDLLGSTDVITDELGNAIGSPRKYDPYGNPADMSLPKLMPGEQLVSSDVHVGFTGHEEDRETGLTNMIGRMYDPRVGHFLSADPLVSDPLSALSLNRYAYVQNNPINYRDPTGLQMCLNDGTPCEFEDHQVHVQRQPDNRGGGGGPDPYVFPGSGGTPEGFQAWCAATYGPRSSWKDPLDWELTRDDVRYVKDPVTNLWTYARFYPGGGMEYKERPGRIIVHEKDGGARDYSFDAYVSMYELPQGPVTEDDQVRIDYYRQFVDDQWGTYIKNPTFVRPMSPGQSASNGHLNNTTGRGRGLNGFSLLGPHQYGSGAADDIAKGIWGTVGATSGSGFAAAVMIPIAGKYLGFAKRGVEGAFSRVLGFTQRNLQKGFTKHGADFGLTGKWNPARAADFSRAANQHINAPGVRAITGTYRGNPATHFLDPKTGVNVTADPAGNYVTGFKLGAEQLESVLTTGRLF